VDIDPTLIFIIIILLAPLIERLLKGGKQQPPPPQQRPRPQQRMPQQRPRPEVQRPEPTTSERQGPEPRPPVVTKRPAPAGYDMRGELPPDEEATIREAPPPEAVPVEGYIREIPRHAPPEIVSLEELVIDDEKRHEAFHARLASLRGSAAARQPKRHELTQRFRASGELRRAIIMSEVLGRPKGLD
jgi:hypothetical protein